MMADQDRLTWWDDIKNLMSAIHAAFGLFGGIVRVLPMSFRPVFAALHLGRHNLSKALFLAYLSRRMWPECLAARLTGILLSIPDLLPCFAFIITIKGY
jgi:hypothetical protein